jgi:D-glycero-alpha-D-manno-heptose-7-phosphate kinase
MPYMTRTPLRVSLFGGGTDYPDYFADNPGAVVGMAIDKHIFIAATRLQTPLEHRYRIAYSKLEMVDDKSKIQHPVVRAVLEDYGVDAALDVSILSDLPSSGGGLGSSSAFTVGFVGLIRAMAGHHLTKIDLAKEAIRFEREVLKENVGVQDQLHAAFGGLNRFDFDGGRYRISPVQISSATEEDLNSAMILIYTNVSRRATEIVEEQIAATKSKAITKDLKELYDMVGSCVSILESGQGNVIQTLGKMLHESWLIKRGLTSKISSEAIDDIYSAALKAGAYGGKLCGAGGGGFILMLAPKEKHAAIEAAVSPLQVLPIAIDTQGATVLMSQPSRSNRPEIELFANQKAPRLVAIS